MLLPNAVDHQSVVETQFEQRLFTRRTDLSNSIRLAIATDALHAMLNGVWGTVTHLTNTYNISRTFVYSLANKLRDAGQYLFGEKAENCCDLSPQELSISMMLSLRMEGQSSLSAISTIMERFGCESDSTGFISQTLSRIGSWLPMTLSSENGIIQYLVFTSDEIFAKTTPILVTVDARSSAILGIELSNSRKAEDWKRHFECLHDNGVEAIYLVSDEGNGIRAGHAAVLSHVVRQSDTYHAIAHQLGSWVDRLETKAYKAIAEEQEREMKLDSAKSDRVLDKRFAQYEKSTETAYDAVTLYDTFSYLYRCVVSELNVFDGNGNLRNRQHAEEAITIGLALIEEFDRKPITKAVNKVRRTLPDLFHYFDVAEDVVNECKKLPIDEESLKAYCIAWQWGKAVEKAKKPGRKKYGKEQEQFCLEIAEGLNQDESEDIRETVYAKLDKIVQSSAMVECINSIIRPYLNTSKNHVTQESLNLIMHYHNHRRYRDGKRKGKTPMELLTGESQKEDWITLLLDMIREKDPGLLLAA